MIVAGGKRNEFATGVLRRDPDGLVALPAAGQNVLSKAREQVRCERGLLQREGMIAPWNDH